ncbi:cupin domain-containing protein [Methylomonas sp. SURF-1]|uniref:Cupin domain-containing protein n=1 Tax=Methylomonas aurea TaxID=2952224 RepID=A0ABT1UKH9_9GAMM|nr:cupin domain-containing protein [Methylomonas sp. SURF-1]MCQ8182747.1 cupin domain-containing protein [Methylomonas sp. SURF-1]
MRNPDSSIAVLAEAVAPRTQASSYPAPFDAQMAGREKRALGDLFGLSRFGVNLTTLQPGARSALRHAHAHQDEFIYVLQGHPTLVTDAGETPLAPGMCAGFKAGGGDAHHLLNRTEQPVQYLEIGNRSPGDSVQYPDDDLQAAWVEGRWRFARKDGTPY